MTVLNDRETAFELEFAHEEQNKFEIWSRRNRLFAVWAAESVGFKGEVADRYIREIVEEFLERASKFPGTEGHIISRVCLDLTTAGWEMTPDKVRKTLAEFEQRARREVLGGTHASAV
jgi:hypothetical protein